MTNQRMHGVQLWEICTSLYYGKKPGKHKLCPYEKLREDIIEERETTIRESGFCEDLKKTKTKNWCDLKKMIL